MKTFNKVFYLNCYYSSLFQVLTRYEINVSNIIINNICSYEIYEHLGMNLLSSELIDLNKLIHLLKEVGVEVAIKYDIEDIIDEICLCVDQNQQIIVFVDAYYLPYRVDVYQKEHTYHAISIHAYDRIKNTMIVCDQSNYLVLDYDERIIGFQEFKEAFSSMKKDLETFRINPYRFDFRQRWRLYYINEIGLFSLYALNKLPSQTQFNSKINKDQIVNYAKKQIKALPVFYDKFFSLSIREQQHICGAMQQRKNVALYVLKEQINPTKEVEGIIKESAKVQSLWNKAKFFIVKQRANYSFMRGERLKDVVLEIIKTEKKICDLILNIYS